MDDLNKLTKGAVLLMMVLVFALSLSIYSQAEPQGATIQSGTTDTGPTFTPDSRNDSGGTINTLTLDSTQQNTGWKAYVGNVTGTLTLDDSNSNTIYDWNIGTSISGEVFVSRNQSVNWTTITCAQQSTVDSEQSFIGGSTSDSDSINSTYNATNHSSMQVGGNSINANSCKTAYTYINNNSQSASQNNNFTAILLEDPAPSLIYASFLEQDATGFDNSTRDFQVIVPEDNSTSNTVTYYFYLEIS